MSSDDFPFCSRSCSGSSVRQAQSLDFLIEWVGSRSQLWLDLHLQFSQCVSAVQAVVPPTPRPQARVLADQPVLSIKIGVAKCASCRILYSLVVAFDDDDGGLTYQPNDCPAALGQNPPKVWYAAVAPLIECPTLDVGFAENQISDEGQKNDGVVSYCVAP